MGCHFFLQGNFPIQGLTPILVSSALQMDSLPMHYKWSEVAQLCLTLCDPMDYSPPGSSIHGIFQARVLEWVAISFSRGSSWPRDRTWVSHIAGRHFTIWATREAYKGKWKSPLDNIKHSVQFSSVAQSCPTLWDPMNHSMPGLPVHHQLPEFTQTHIHRVSDAIQQSHPLSSPSPPAPNPSQHQASDISYTTGKSADTFSHTWKILGKVYSSWTYARLMTQKSHF